MLKLITAATLMIFANNVYADACFDDCNQTCLRSGSLARTCQLECTAECPPTKPPPPPVCTTVDNSAARNSCVANDTAWYFSCLGLFPVWPFGPGWCSTQFLNAVNTCPASQLTVCH